MLLRSQIYKHFGFRTLVTTGCVNCKSNSRRVEYNLSYDVNLQRSRKTVSAMRASELMKFEDANDGESLAWKMIASCFKHSAKV